MKHFSVTAVVLLVCVNLFIFQPAQHTLNAIDGCSGISSLNGTLNKEDVHRTGNLQFNSGDLITIIVKLVNTDSNQSARVRVRDLGGDVFYDTMPAVVYYRVGKTQVGSFEVENSATGKGDPVTVQAFCNTAGPIPQFSDGRLNFDPGQEAAIYCSGGGVVVYRVINSQGYLSLRVSKATIDRVPQYPKTNTLIAEDTRYKVRLYRLTSSELQINATSQDTGKEDYHFTWKGCQSK